MLMLSRFSCILHPMMMIIRRCHYFSSSTSVNWHFSVLKQSTYIGTEPIFGMLLCSLANASDMWCLPSLASTCIYLCLLACWFIWLSAFVSLGGSLITHVCMPDVYYAANTPSSNSIFLSSFHISFHTLKQQPSFLHPPLFKTQWNYFWYFLRQWLHFQAHHLLRLMAKFFVDPLTMVLSISRVIL